MTKWVKEVESMKLELEKKKGELETLDGFTKIYNIIKPHFFKNFW